MVLMKVKSTSVTSFEIHKDTKFVHGSAFSDCTDLVSIIVPDGLISIGMWATYDCENLSVIYYGGSADNWDQVLIKDLNNIDYTTTIYYYSESQPTTEGNWWHYVNNVPTAWE